MSSSCIQAFSLVVFSIFFKNWRSVSKMRNVSKVEVTWHIKMHNKQISEPGICNRVSDKAYHFLNAESIGEGFASPFSTYSLHRWTAKKVMTSWLSLRRSSPTDGRSAKKSNDPVPWQCAMTMPWLVMTGPRKTVTGLWLALKNDMTRDDRTAKKVTGLWLALEKWHDSWGPDREKKSLACGWR